MKAVTLPRLWAGLLDSKDGVKGAGPRRGACPPVPCSFVSRPELTLTDAAAACGVSRDTIDRRRKAGDFPGARMADGRWVIPTDDLLAAGLRLHAPAAEVPPVAPDEVEQLRGQLAAARAEADRWRAVAEERDRAVSLAELALRALPAPQAPIEGPRRRAWWRRR